LAPQIAFREANLAVDLIGVDRANWVAQDGQDLRALTPFPDMPLLELEDGATLRGIAPLLYYAALHADGALGPAPGSWNGVRLAEQIDFVSSYLQPSIGGLRQVATASELKRLLARLARGLALLDTHLSLNPFIGPDRYSIADIYSWAVTSAVDISLWRFDHLDRWHAQIRERPAVRAALAAERALFGR
jgi:glutathione S-transferase